MRNFAASAQLVESFLPFQSQLRLWAASRVRWRSYEAGSPDCFESTEGEMETSRPSRPTLGSIAVQA